MVEASGSWTVPQADRSALIEAGRFLLFRFLPVGVSFAAYGYVLSLLGWDSRQVQSASTVFALAVVLGEAALLSDREAGLRDFFRASLFLVLTTPLLQFAPLGMDSYNFHLVAGLNEVWMPSFLALTVNLSLASVAGLMFNFLHRWQYGQADRGHGAFRRAAMVVFPQALMVYGVVLVISNL